MSGNRTVLRFVVAFGLAVAGLILLLSILGGTWREVHAAANRSTADPMGLRNGELAAPRPEPSWNPVRAPGYAPPAAPLLNGVGGSQPVITVCQLSALCPYTSVQQALIDATPGYIIKVAQGLYDDVYTFDGHQQVVYITKSLTLRGGYTVTNWTVSDPDGNPTILDAGGQSDTRVVYIAAGVAPTIEGFHIRDGNMPGDNGAGVYISGGEPGVRRNRIYQNQAEFGSGVYIFEGSPLIENCLIYSNTADKGAGVYVRDGSPVIQFDTLHGNEATEEGGGVYVALDGMPAIRASIIASNTARTAPPGGGGIFSLGDEDFIEVQYNDVVGNVGGDYVGLASVGNIQTPPAFVDPSAADFRLRANSGCIGRDAPNYPIEGPADDFDNYGRPFGQFPDIGAHEYHAPSACYARVDSGRVYTSVQEAADAADDKGLVRVTGWCTGTGDNVVEVDKDIALIGGYTTNNWDNPDAAVFRTTLDGEGGRRVIYVDQYVNATIEGFDIFNGRIGLGAGVYLDTGSDSIIQDNRIYSNGVFGGGGMGYGGGIYVRSSGPTVRDNEIYSNTAARRGGGICIDEVRGGDVVIESNTIRANRSAEGGGGIGVDDSRRDGDVVIRHNEIYSNVNSTLQGGGGVLCLAGSCVIQYNVIYSNTALSQVGGGIKNGGTQDGANSAVEYNRIYGNVAKGGGGGIHSEGVLIARYNVISGNVASDASGRGGGINANGRREYENLLVESNRIYGNTSGKYGGGVALSYAWPAEPVTVTARNNLIFANTAPRGAGCSIRGEFVYVENNTIYGNIGHGIDEEDLKSTGVIRANIIVSNTGYGISMYEGNFSSVYNDVWGNDSGGSGIQCEDPDHCASSGGNISADPRFKDPAEPDFGLQPDSLCRDAVLTTTHAAYDYDHYARPFGAYADMGAHELYIGSCFATLSTGVGVGGRVYTSVQAAVLTATDGVDDVLVAGVCEGTDAVATIDKSLALRGGYTKSNWTEPTASTVLDAKGQDRVVTITGASNLTVTVGELIVRGASQVGIYVATSLSPTIRNVIAYDNGDAFTLAAGGSPRLYNNTFVSNTGDGIDLSGSGLPIISNTIVVSNAGNGISGTMAVLAYNDVWNNGVDYQGLSPGTTDISVAPAFQDPASGDFHLSFDSPCLHAGDPNTGLTWDFEGDLRPDNTGEGQRYDIGADEASDYLGVDIGPTIYRVAAPDDLIQYTHYLTNSGTRDGSFSISSTLEVNEGNSGDWVFTYDSDHTLLAGEATAVPVSVEVPGAGQVQSGTLATLFLTATYQSGGVSFFDVTSDTILVQSDWGFTLSTLEDQTVDPGQVVTYAHTLRNLGSPDTFTLTVSSSLGWAEVVPADQVGELGNGQSAPVYVIVSVPITASSDAVEQTVVVATSQGAASGGELLQRTITDTFYVQHIYGDRYVAVAGSDNGGYNSCLISTSPCGTIRQAIKQASGGEVIRVSEGEYREFNVALNEAVKLEGGYSEDDWDVRDPESYVTTINAQGSGRVLYVGGSPVVEGFTLRNGDVNGFGGGVYIAQGADPTLRWNVITGNRARSSGGVPGRGGGIYNAGGDPTLERNIVTGNTADEFGGGIYNRQGAPNIWNNLVYDNDGTDYGGGFYNYGGSPLAWFNTFVRNTADRGGGLYLHSGSPSISDTIVFSNTASTQGGGIYISAAGAVVDYSALGGNTPDQYAGLSVGGHNTSANPLFVSAATDDFHLRKASPLRDIGDGVDPGVLSEDYDGQPRTMNGAPDIGADEYQRADVVLLSLDSVQIGDESEVLTYTHILTNTGNYLDEFLVTWESDLTAGWTITVNGSTAQPVLMPELSQFATTTVEVLIQVPADVLSGTVNQTTITATSVLDPEVADDAKNTTLVGRSVGVSLEPNIDGWADPLNTVVYTHTLTNEGNCTDTFDLAISPDAGNFVNSIDSPSPPVVVLAKEESVDVVVSVYIKSTAFEAEAHTTLVTATSRTEPSASAVVTDTTVAQRKLGMELAPDSSGSALTGLCVSHQHVLTNTGNYTDTYLFTVASALGWPVKVDDKEPPVSLEVGAWPPHPTMPGARTVDVEVCIPMPPDAFGGEVETTMITATSEDNGESKSVTDVTTALQREGVELWPNYSNLKYVDQKETETEKFLRRVLATGSSQVVTFTHNLYNNNTSNSTDTYTLDWSVTPAWSTAVDPTDTGEMAWHDIITDVVVTLDVPMQPEQPSQAAVATIFVTATSGFNPTGPYGRAAVTDTVVVNQRVEAAWSPGSTRMAQYDSAGEDGTAVYAHTLTNAGNYTDSFTIAFLSDWGKAVKFEGVDSKRQTPDIGAGKTHVITVEVTVPYAQCGLTGDVIITATSRTPGPAGTSGYTPTAGVVDTIAVNPTYFAAVSPALERRYVSTTTTEIDKVYTHWVTNTGNCANRFSLGAQGSFTPAVLPLVTDWLSSVLHSGVSGQLVAVTVTVPRTDPANLVTGSVEITASGELGGFSIVTDTIIINQQVQAALGPDGTDTISEAGSVNVFYTHILTNEGNYDDTFELTWWNENGWTVQLKVPGGSFKSKPPVQSAVLAPGGTAQIDVQVRVPSNVYTVTNRTWITATSLTPSDAEEVALYSPTATTVDTTLVRRPHVTIGPDLVGDINPGASHVYTNILTNTGGLMDSYTITCESLLLGWLDDCGPVTVQDVSPGETREITVAVTVAQAAEPGDYDEAVITATSWMSYTPTVYDIAVDTTNVLYILDAELSPEDPYTVEPGTTVTFTHQLTNTGNYTESFTLSTGQEFSDVDVNPSEIEDLPPGQSTSVEVTVGIPRFAPGGEAEQVNVNVFGFHQVLQQTTNVETVVDIVNISPTVGTRFVAPNGSDENNNCTMRDDKEPCLTVQHGVDQAVDGDTVKVTSGTYVDVLDADQVVRVGKSITVTGGYTLGDWIVSQPDIRPTILDAEGERRVMVIEASITPTIEGFHLHQGSVDGDDGAGLYIAEGSVPTVRVNRIYNNTATQSGTDGGRGGGIYFGGGATPTFERNAIYDNFARRGGGVYLESGDARLWSNLIYDNEATIGGGLYNSSGDPVVRNNTFRGNTASSPGGGGGGIFADSGALIISSTIVVNNVGYGILDGGTAEFTLAYNDVWHNTPSDYSPPGIPHDDDISENPLFLDASNNELRLTFRSPCIDAGDLDVATPPDEDYEGNPRVLFGRRDIGAYEYGIMGTKTVTPAAQTDTIITYTVRVVNIGTAAHTIVVTDVLNEFLDPTGVLAYSLGGGGYVTPTRSITWTGLVPGNGTVATITFTARITDGVANYTPIPNVAWIDHGAADTVTTIVIPRLGTRYVAKTGDDTDNDCRINPCRTIQYAVEQAQPGDEVRVAGSAIPYADGVITVGKQITLSGGFAPLNWVTFDPNTNETTLQAPGLDRPSVVISGSVVRLAGFHIVDGADGVSVINGGDLTLYRSWVHDNTDGVQAEDSSFTLINSVVAWNTSVGLRATASDSVLVHNTFANNAEGGAVIDGVAHITNTIFSTNTVGISVTGNAELWNTLWWGGDVYTTGATIIEHSSIISKPLFVDADNVDYHILEDSGAVDQGTLIDGIVVKEDFDGEARVVRDGPDIGADEFPLGLTKTGPSAAEPGQMITYTIELKAVDVDLVITDVLPIYLTYASATNSLTCTAPACSINEAEQTMTWTGDSTEVVYITYTGHLAPWLGKGEIITNSALLERRGRVGESVAWETVISQVHGTRYVAPTGVNEEPDGTDNNCLVDWKPCRTVQWAVDQAMNGDTVKVAAGSYTSTASSVVRIDKSVTLVGGCSMAAPGWTCDPKMYETKLDAQASASNRRRVIEIAGTPGPVTVDGFHLLNGYVNNSGGGIRASGATVVLMRDRIYGNTAAGSSGGGVYLSNVDATIVDSRIYANTTTGFGAGIFAWQTDFDLTNNVLADNLAGSGGDGMFVDGLTGSFGEMRHNTIADNGNVGVRVNNKFSVGMTNTILSGHAVAGIEAIGDAVVTVDHTLLRATDTLSTGSGSVVDTATLTGDPRFVDPSTWDYHIRPDSAALDAGVEAGVTVDIDGDLRPMGHAPDVGADELRVELSVSKQVEPSVAVAGIPLTYTIRLTNTGQLTLTTTITDFLPAGVEPAPLIRTWSLPAFAPGELWQTDIVMTAGFSGTLVNEVQVTSTEGATGSDIVTSVVTGEPIIDVSPPSLSTTLPATGTITLTLAIRNQGNVDLNWSLTESVDVAWLDESPTSGVVAPSSSTDVNVGFDANGLEEGRSYTTALLIDSDDPNRPQVSVDVRLTVGTVDHLVYLPLVMRNH
jgi:uncharacterized repeat protein (TIGR01451 family)